MLKFLKIYILTAFAVIIAACSDSTGIDDDAVITPNDAVIKPLSIGNTWNYINTELDTAGTVVFSTEDFTKIVASQEIDGETWYIEQQGENPALKQTLVNRGDGLYTDHGHAYFHPDSPYRIVAYPVVKGEEFIVNRYEIAGKTRELYRRVLDVNIKTTVPAGTFRCIKYADRLTDHSGRVLQDTVNINYYAPNVGLVKSMRYREFNGKLYNWAVSELEGYYLEKNSNN